MAITDEVWWKREFAPPAITNLRERLLSFFGIPGANIGIKGNTAHTRGYHRSHAWVRNSAFCTNRTYSVSETPGNRVPGHVDWLCAMDITLDQARLIAMCKRLDIAIRAGVLEKITEWYGNDDGDNQVDGYNNIRNVVATSDPSHLWHLHLSFDRGRANEDHTDLYYVLTGADMQQNEKLVEATANPQRTVGDVFADLSNMRDWLYSPAAGGVTLVNPPPAGSVARKILAGGLLTLTPENLTELTAILRAIVREELDRTQLGAG